MKDRIPTYPGRMKLTDTVSGEVHVCDVEMADQPTEVGTAQNKALFDYAFAAIGTTAGTGTAYTLAGDGGFSLTDGATVRFKLHVDSGATPTLNVNGTGAKALKSDYYSPMAAGIKAGTWLSAAYCADFGFFVLLGSGQKFVPYFHVSTASESITIADSGVYRITAIGAGADGYDCGDSVDRRSYYEYKCDGGCGGGGYLETRLVHGDTLAIVISGSASVSKGGNAIITATAGGTSGYQSAVAPKAGTVSGTGVVAFTSNGTATKNLTPPSGVYPAAEASKGGDSGFRQSSRSGSFASDGSNGGNGLYGGDGGSGGTGYSYSYNSTAYNAATTGIAGGYSAGSGGNGLGSYYSSSGTSHYNSAGGSGGGGGFGGGGGAPWSYLRYYASGDEYYIFGGEGKGGAAGVIIERIS